MGKRELISVVAFSVLMPRFKETKNTDLLNFRKYFFNGSGRQSAPTL